MWRQLSNVMSNNIHIQSPLPRKLKDLRRLRYLLLRNTAISEAPSGLFSSMKSLELLDLSSFHEVSQRLIIDNSLDGLKGRLKGLGINACSQFELDKLNELSMPITRLNRWIRKYESGPSIDLLPRPKRPRDPTWSNMKYLEVKGECRVVTDGLFELESDQPIEALVVHESYGCFPKHLSVVRHDDLEEIVWKGVNDRGAASLNRLTFVTIHNCDKLKHLSWIHNLPLLTVLDVRWCARMEHVIREEEEEEEEEEGSEIEHEHHVPSQLPPAIFPALRSLRLQTLPELKSICSNRAISLPCLEYLLVSNCPSLKKLPFDTPASCRKLKKIEAGRKWWEDTLELDGDMRTYLQSRFVEPPIE